MNQWYATFGGGHTHPLTEEPLRDCYTVIPAPGYNEAHQMMMRSVFGRKWAFLYEYADLPEQDPNNRRAAGVIAYGLREIPFIPPSPVSLALWAAYETELSRSSSSPTRWLEQVAHPAEVAHQRAMLSSAPINLVRSAEVEPAKDDQLEQALADVAATQPVLDAVEAFVTAIALHPDPDPTPLVRTWRVWRQRTITDRP